MTRTALALAVALNFLKVLTWVEPPRLFTDLYHDHYNNLKISSLPPKETLHPLVSHPLWSLKAIELYI